MDECLRGLIFGLPKSHWSYVYYIEPGLPVFLFNYHDRNMHGIFRAVSYGQLEINPHGAPLCRGIPYMCTLCSSGQACL